MALSIKLSGPTPLRARTRTTYTSPSFNEDSESDSDFAGSMRVGQFPDFGWPGAGRKCALGL
jgi:hypothetical protein